MSIGGGVFSLILNSGLVYYYYCWLLIIIIIVVVKVSVLHYLPITAVSHVTITICLLCFHIVRLCWELESMRYCLRF